MEAILALPGISIDQFANLHVDSDLDGLAITFADSTNSRFKDNEGKISYGLSRITAIERLDCATIGRYIQSIRV